MSSSAATVDATEAAALVDDAMMFDTNCAAEAAAMATAFLLRSESGMICGQ
jgi:hypothetical protein